MSSSHDITLTPQEQALIMRLKSFRVPEMAHILEEQLKDPNADLNTFMERMTAMVEAEWQARADKRFNRLIMIRLKEEKESEVFPYLSRIEKSLKEQGFSVKRADREDIKRILAVYYEQNVTTEKFEDFDGERWIIPED